MGITLELAYGAVLIFLILDFDVFDFSYVKFLPQSPN
jgi:hypothetical protein